MPCVGQYLAMLIATSFLAYCYERLTAGSDLVLASQAELLRLRIS